MIGIVTIVIGVFVSNERDREMRGSSAQGAELDSSVRNSSFRENQVTQRRYLLKGPLSQGQVSSRKLIDPSPRIGLSTV